MMATTSFMITPSVFREALAVRRTAGQIWHLSGQMAQKTCTVREKTFEKAAPIAPVQGSGGSARMSFERDLGSRLFAGGRNVRSILVCRRQRPAAGPFSGSPVARFRRGRDGHGRCAGLDRGDGWLAKGGGNPRTALARSYACAVG